MPHALAEVARREAKKFYHGNVMGVTTNLHPISEWFPYSKTWDVNSWDNGWCAAFVYHCCKKAGYDLPVRDAHPSVTCNFAGCIAWEQWAKHNGLWLEKTERPRAGDIVLFDNAFQKGEHDHIAVVLRATKDYFAAAEGNFNNVSAIVRRGYEQVRGYVRLPRKEETI